MAGYLSAGAAILFPPQFELCYNATSSLNRQDKQTQNRLLSGRQSLITSSASASASVGHGHGYGSGKCVYFSILVERKLATQSGL